MAGPVLIAGAGIAGLTMALALARRGIPARVVEQAPKLEATGAGIQLSPNATRILIALGLETPLREASVQPERVRMIDAGSGAELAHVPLGAWGQTRWDAPYLTIHRGDLQQILLDAANADEQVTISLDAPFEPGAAGTVIGADGIHSAVRRHSRLRPSRASGFTAWRATLTPEKVRSLDLSLAPDAVSAFLHPRAHLVAYPVRGGQLFNLVAFSRTGGEVGRGSDRTAFAYAMRGAMPALAALATQKKLWSAWDLRTVPPASWVHPGPTVLIGDAAHATTPFAAQGAAMAIEDAWTLAAALGEGSDLRQWEAARKRRMRRVVRRGLLNSMAWHASGPAALARNMLFRRWPAEKLARDLDWLYGWRFEGGEPN